jgi:hypothetical protein
MPLSLWNQQLVGGQVPSGHAFHRVISLYSTFRNTIGGDLNDFGNWRIREHGAEPGGVNAFNFPLTQNQLNIAALNNEEVQLLANDPQGRFARIFLHQWYRCDLQSEFPKCLADVYIVGTLRQRGLNNQELIGQILALGYAGKDNAAITLKNVGNGIGRHFGFLGEDELPTAFFNSFFQDRYFNTDTTG